MNTYEGTPLFREDHLPNRGAPRRDIKVESEDTEAMNDITREELDAKLDASNARIDARLASFEGTVRETMSAIRLDSAESKGELKALHIELGHLKNIKGSIWGAAGASVVGIAGVLTAMLSFGVASYDTARENTELLNQAKSQVASSQEQMAQTLATMSAQLEDAKRQSSETQRLLQQIQAQQSSQNSNPSTGGRR